MLLCDCQSLSRSIRGWAVRIVRRKSLLRVCTALRELGRIVLAVAATRDWTLFWTHKRRFVTSLNMSVSLLISIARFACPD